ncbi:MAG: polysaccharide lyase family 8 super-sandwich domain-containing protein [Flavisolibacter sp.]
MKRKLLGCLGLVLLFQQLMAQGREAETFLDRYKTFLLLTDTSYGASRPMVLPDKAGRWKDINYSDDQPGGWQLRNHMLRIKDMALLWSFPSSPSYHNGSLKKHIDLALADWFVHHYKSKNWWHNEIGIPQLMRDILVLMKDSLNREQFGQCLQILKQYRVNGTGANLVWSADLGLHYGAFTGDTALMRLCRDTILTVIKITTAEGVQPDYSFHQHGKRLQMYHYGGAFLLDDVRLAWQLRGLSLAFPQDKVQVLTDFVLKGWQWMARGIETVPGTIDRAASRKDALHSADIRFIIPLLYKIQPDSLAAFKKMLEVQNGKEALTGYRYYPYSDFTAFQEQEYSFFLKTNSERTLLTESINEENIKGGLLNNGDSYYISNGREYFNLMPFWDWDRLPGMTNFESDNRNKIRSQSFTGNVSNGFSGLAVMDECLENREENLHARKCWASWKNVTVSLIAGLETRNVSGAVFTALDQCRLQGSVTVNGGGPALSAGSHGFSHLKWVHHSHFVYLPLPGDSLVIHLENVSGRWSDINHSESSALLQDKIFMPLMIHKQKASGFVVAYAPSTAKAAAIANHPSWNVLRNDTVCQAVLFQDGTGMAALYRPGMASIASFNISVSRPCLILWKDQKILASDPSHKGGELHLDFNHHCYTTVLPTDGTSVPLSLERAGEDK